MASAPQIHRLYILLYCIVAEASTRHYSPLLALVRLLDFSCKLSLSNFLVYIRGGFRDVDIVPEKTELVL